jgi:hypothetical protein
MVITVSALDTLYRNPLRGGLGAWQGHHELLLGQNGRLPPGRGSKPDGCQLEALSTAAADRAIETVEQWRLPPCRRSWTTRDDQDAGAERTLQLITRTPASWPMAACNRAP